MSYPERVRIADGKDEEEIATGRGRELKMIPLLTIGSILFVAAIGLIFWADGATNGRW